MSDRTAVRLEPHEIAPLGEGPRAAVTVAVVDLHLRGLVEADLPGAIRAGAVDVAPARQPLAPLSRAATAHRRRDGPSPRTDRPSAPLRVRPSAS